MQVQGVIRKKLTDDNMHTCKSDRNVLSAVEFNRVFASCRSRFEIVARRYVRNDAVAEDIVAESFMVLWENRERIARNKNIQAYVLTIVRNKCLDYLRAQNLHLQIEQNLHRLRQEIVLEDIRSLEAFDPREIFSDEVAAIVRQTLERMPELMRCVFIARRFEDKSYKEIGQMYGITPRRVEFELQKAVKEFRVALRDYLPALLILILNVLEN